MEILKNKWSEIPYGKETALPNGLEPQAGSWPLNYFKRLENGTFQTLSGTPVSFELINPCVFDFSKELKLVVEKSKNLTPKEIAIAKFWGFGVPLNQLSPIVLQLINTYNLAPPRAARLSSIIHKAINDAFIITWHFKYLFDKPRPIQLDPTLQTVLNTPRFPTYPSGHSVVSGATMTILSYFFQGEQKKLMSLAEEASISRFYGGIHFKCDLSQGLRLGKYIGNLIIEEIKKETDTTSASIDYPILEFLDAPIIPDLNLKAGSTNYNYSPANFSNLSTCSRI